MIFWSSYWWYNSSFFIPILEKFVVKSKTKFLDEAKDELNKS